MSQRARRFREQASRENHGRGGVRLRYSKRLRREAVSYCQEKRRQGWNLKAVAAELGVHAWSLSRWTRELEGDGELRKVEVVGHEQNPPGVGLTLVSPEGFRVEGLDVEGARQLLLVLR
jgi:AraC-like DNA-binding protein